MKFSSTVNDVCYLKGEQLSIELSDYTSSYFYRCLRIHLKISVNMGWTILKCKLWHVIGIKLDGKSEIFS